VTAAAATDRQPMIGSSSVLVRIGVCVALHVVVRWWLCWPFSSSEATRESSWWLE
jgi:hypothetical protein